MGRTYLLDTNIISYLTDPKSPHRTVVKEKLFSLSQKDRVAVSILTLYEPEFDKKSYKQKKREAVV